MFDSALIKMIRSDQNKGLSNLIDQYTPLVYTIVRNKISSVCSAEDIEEVVSDVFITFYNQIESVDLSKGSIAAYLMTIAKRKAVDKFRK
ncbi:MAG: RNA polymerase subunit sigma-24, partial [Eubacterium sp.]|nr:RNA polymerase subunit sigma-24 [Eubacterium sp.]